MNGHVQMWHKSSQPNTDGQPEVIKGMLGGHVAVTQSVTLHTMNNVYNKSTHKAGFPSAVAQWANIYVL